MESPSEHTHEDIDENTYDEIDEDYSETMNELYRNSSIYSEVVGANVHKDPILEFLNDSDNESVAKTLSSTKKENIIVSNEKNRIINWNIFRGKYWRQKY